MKRVVGRCTFEKEKILAKLNCFKSKTFTVNLI